MSYAVDRTADARATLAAIWVASAHRRSAITTAQARIDRLLGSDPMTYGSPNAEGLYALEVHPIRVLFEVSAQGRYVTVVAVGELR